MRQVYAEFCFKRYRTEDDLMSTVVVVSCSVTLPWDTVEHPCSHNSDCMAEIPDPLVIHLSKSNRVAVVVGVAEQLLYAHAALV